MAGTAPAKPAARPVKATKARPKVTLNLDALSKKQAMPDVDLPTQPFTFLLHGVTYELGDPRDADWKLALELSRNPFLLMRTMLTGADDPVEDPTEDEIQAARERHGLPMRAPLPGSDQAKAEAEAWPDGIVVALIDRFTMADLPGWKLDALFGNWNEHYRIDLKDGQGILAAILGK